MLAALRKSAHAVSQAMTVIACGVLALATVHIFADVIATKFFHAPINGTHISVTAYYMVALFFLPLAFAELHGKHISADLFSYMLPERVRLWLERLNLLLLTGFLAVLTWQATVKAISQTERGEQETAAGVVFLIWPSRWLVVLGFGAMALIALLRLAENVLGREPAGLQEGESDE